MNNKVGFKRWLAFIVAGLVGQLAWAIENNYLNLYVFDCTHEYGFIPVMTAASAAAATITTLLMGILSDKLGKRKAFISIGYILWGISIIGFAFLDPGSALSFVNGNIALSGSLIVVMDCVMTFFGSTANDACFNAMVTENTEPDNRGKVESVLSILPLVSLIAVILVGGFLVDNKADTHWDIFFYIFGGLTIAAGVACIFILPKDKVEKKDVSFVKSIIYGFKPSVIKDNKLLYFNLLIFMIFNIAIQIYMPYYMVYIQQILNIQGGDFTITMGVVMVVSCVITVIFGGLFMDKIGKNKIIIPALLISALGGILMTFVKEKIFLMFAGTILITGYLIGTSVIGAKVRDYTPEKEVGLFQGIRMIFAVLLPMVIGPYLGQAVSYINKTEYVNEYGANVLAPNQFIFLGCAVVCLLAIIPVIFLLKKEKANNDTTK